MKRYLILFAVALAVSNAHGQNFVANHSFENPVVGSAQVVPTGWFSSNNPGGLYIDNTAAFVTDGAQYAQIGAFLEQNTGVAVIPGATYRLAFDYVSFTDDPLGPAYAQLFTNPNPINDPLDAGNQVLLSDPLPTGPTSTVLPQSFDVVVPGTASGYLFVRFLNGNNFRGLDDVQLTLLAVPEPSSVFLAGAGLLSGIGMVRRRAHHHSPGSH